MGLVLTTDYFVKLKKSFKVTKPAEILNIVDDLEGPSCTSMQPGLVTVCQSEILEQAQVIAAARGAAHVSTFHLMLALLLSSDPRILLLFQRLKSGRSQRKITGYQITMQSKSKAAPSASVGADEEKSGLTNMYDPDTEQVMKLALAAARAYQLMTVGAEFVLLGLLKAPGIARQAFAQLGIDDSKLISALDMIFQRRKKIENLSGISLKFSSDVDLVVGHAQTVARRNRSFYLETEHVLLAMLEKKLERVLMLLNILNVAPEQIVQEVRKLNPDIRDVRL